MHLVTFTILGAITLVFGGNSNEQFTREFRQARFAKQMEEDFKKYPNMSLVLLEKCKKLKQPHKVTPCTLSVLDNDQKLMIDIMQTNPFVLINLVSHHQAKFPDVPLRPMKPNGKCRKPAFKVGQTKD